MKTSPKTQVNTIETVRTMDTRLPVDFKNLIKMSAFALNDGPKEFTNIDELLDREHHLQLASKAAFENAQLLIKLNGSASLGLDSDELKTYENLAEGMTSLLVQLTQETRALSRLVGLFGSLGRA